MNFGGGPFQNGQYQQNVPPFNPMGQPVQPPPTGIPIFPAMSIMPIPSVHPGIMPAAPLQASYPPGQGPLAGRPVQRGSNGLLEAPEAEGPEEHEAVQYIKLNPAEELKYNEYWTQACEGAETVSGPHAVEFLSRAAKVSKGQLRRIWDIADYQKEGALDQKQFYVALRLLALAQRGAELSIAGLRNFTGIQLIPSIDPPPKEEPEEPASAPEPQKLLFSWTITPEAAARYDTFFKNLDNRNVGVIDGKQGVTFFSKSGLPRPTLKKIWGLADVTQDGVLSLDEFRTAMHMVTCIRNKRLTVTALPDVLDPNGPNWLRVAGAYGSSQTAPAQPTQTTSVLPPTSPSSNTQQPPPAQGERSPINEQPQPPVITPMPPPPQVSSPPHEPAVIPGPPPPPHSDGSPESQIAMQAPASQTPAPPQKMSSAQASFSEAAAITAAAREAEHARKEAESMRDALRKEKLEFERARREMQEMKAEMERLRIEKESFAMPPPPSSISAHVSALPPSYGQAVQAQSVASKPALTAIPAAATPLVNSSIEPTIAPASGPSSGGSHRVTAAAASMVDTSAPAGPPQTMATAPITPQPSAANNPASIPSAAANREKPLDVGADDDDIWNQPSPKASALPGPSNLAGVGGKNKQSQDSVSSDDDDDDDDDFWGAGLAPKPTLGPAGGQKSGQTGSKGFGGSELDDWVF